MVIFYKNDGEIIMAEHYVMEPTFNKDLFTLEGITQDYKNEGISFVAVDYELESDIGDYKVLLDDDGNFKGLYPRGVDI